MGQTLTNGIYLPDEGERNSYPGLEVNWRTLDALILTVNGKAAPNIANTWTAAQTFNAGLTGDLTGNVTGDLTGTASQAIADEDGTSIKTGYVNVAGNQTVTGNKEFTGSNTFNNILPNATNTYSLGSSSYQWSAVYAQSYYYNGTEFSSKFVTTDTSQTINADKEFETGKFLRVGGYRFQLTSDLEPGTTPSANQWTGFQFTGAGRTLISEIVQSYQTNGNTLFQINVVNNEANAVKKTIFEYVYKPINNVNFIRTTVTHFIPTTSSVSNLGTSTNKWKTLNGVNPGALSLPDLNNTVDITSTFNTAIDKTQTVNSYTADFTGWFFINWWTEGLTNPFYVYVYCTNSATDNNLLNAVWGQSFSVSGNVDYMLTQFPVISGKTYWFVTNFSRASTDTKNLAYSVRKLPCLGNV